MPLPVTRAIAVAAGILFANAVAHAAFESHLAPPAQLNCEHQPSPLSVHSSKPLLGWMLGASDASLRGVRQSAYRIVVSSSEALAAEDKGDLWDSGRVQSDRTRDIPYSGKSLEPEQQVYWRAEVWDENGHASRWSAVATFTMAPDHWQAMWIAAAPDGSPEGKAEGVTRPMPVFRHVFQIHRPVARALLYVSGMGQDEAHINGNKVGHDELTPGWTEYRKRILYDTYDVTSMLHDGTNAIGILLGNGMFNVARTPGRYTKLVGTFGQPQCIAELHVVFADGSRTVIATGPEWQTASGPVTYSSTYGGEDYDARKTPRNWDTVGPVDDSAWHPAEVVPGPGGRLEPETAAPLRVEYVYQRVSRRTLASGDAVIDLGQNFAGWPDITVQGEAGAEVRLTAGELLASDGSVSQASANAHPDRAQWYSYTLSGKGVERWHPRFSYYGFRYVQVHISGAAKLISLTGDAVHSSAAPTGAFHSSIPLLDQIHTLILRAIENNMASVLTDCPHREKLGWLEQSHLMGSALNYDFDLERFYNKIENDMADEQQANGRVPTIAPEYTVFSGNPDNPFNDSPEWGSAAALDPWIAYRRYGDLDALRAHYSMMRGYVDYLTSRSQDGIVDFGLGDWYDIGPNPPGVAQLTSRALTATAVYYQDILAVEQAAAVLHDTPEKKKMAALRDAVAAAFQKRFYHADQHDYDRDSQTANAMPLVLGLVPPQDRTAVLRHLIDDIRAHGNHVTAGDVGFHYVVDALMENGASDVLLDMLLRTDAPSYGYQLHQDATALTEAWDASPHSSQDHLMLGHAEEWFYAGAGGIHVDFSRPEQDQIELQPALLPRIGSGNVQYRSVKGLIRVAWSRGPHATVLDVTIPANATARVLFPPGPLSTILESGKAAAHAAGVISAGMSGGLPEIRVGSGEYHFSIPRAEGTLQ